MVLNYWLQQRTLFSFALSRPRHKVHVKYRCRVPFLVHNISAQNNVNILVEKPEGTRTLFIHGCEQKATLKLKLFGLWFLKCIDLARKKKQVRAFVKYIMKLWVCERCRRYLTKQYLLRKHFYLYSQVGDQLIMKGTLVRMF